MTDQWWLCDVEERNRQVPDTFHIPSKSTRESLRAGDQAKLIFEIQPIKELNNFRGERMWVAVTTVLPDGRYRGELSVTPSFIPISIGLPIEFGPENVLGVIRGA